MRKFLPFLLLATILYAARPALPVILIDLSHGQQYNGVCAMMKDVPNVYWIVMVPDEDTAESLPPCIKYNAYEIWTGNFADNADMLNKVDMIIIGQPVEFFEDDEIEAIASWWNAHTQRVLWCAGDSDYPAQGGNLEIADHACDQLFEALKDVRLRIDFVSVEDPISNAGRSYRVIALVEPPNRYNATLLKIGAKRVLMHGPGAVAWVDDEGNWHKVTDPNTPKNIIPILVTTDKAVIVEHQPRAPGEPGEFGRAHIAGERGRFVLLAAQIIEEGGVRKVVIASGESPYYGYQSMVSFYYHNKYLDGPEFFRNLIYWSLNMLGFLTPLAK